MKRLNKKGFTLAELLIVIAIIAILIAIAIPAFSASLHRANIATDHANIRNAYAIAKTADLTKFIDDGSANGVPTKTGDVWVYCKDGSVKISTTSDIENLAYKLKEEATTGECSESQGCGNKEDTHKKNSYILIKEDSTKTHWTVSLEASIPSGAGA